MSSGRAPPPCAPTWRGHIETTKDALIIFEACLQGILHHCIRRPHDRERSSLIVSGNVFVYEEGTSGIKRWTDGIPWSPSRILTNFLIYRQLNSPFPPGEKKRATKRSQRPVKAGEPYAAPGSSGNAIDDGYPVANPPPITPGLKSEEAGDKDADRILVGSLVDSYEFKDGGLLKKTMTVTHNGVQHHLVSYYSLEDAKFNLITPRDDHKVKDIPLRDELLNQPKFKVQNFDDAGDGVFDPVDNQQTSFNPYLRSGIQTMGSFTTPTHSHFSQQDQSPGLYYPTYTPYGSQVQTPTSISNVGFASMPATPTTYTPIAATSTAYPPFPQQTQHQNSHQASPQPQRRSSNQAYIKPEPQSQFYPPFQQQPQYQSSSQLHQLSHQEHKPISHANYQQQSPSETTPRRDGVMNILTNTPDPLGISNHYYSQGGNVGASFNDASILLPQPMNMPYSNNYGGTSDGSYYTSRATS